MRLNIAIVIRKLKQRALLWMSVVQIACNTNSPSSLIDKKTEVASFGSLTPDLAVQCLLSVVP